MTKVNNSFIMPVPAGRGAQGDLHQHNQQNQPGNGAEKEQNGGRLIEPDTFQPASPIGTNLYIEAHWGAEKVKPNSPQIKVKPNSQVQIIAQLNTALTTKATIIIIHKIDGQNVPVETISADMKAGRVETIWQAKNPANNRSQGHYFFMIYGGKANAMSENNLFLS